MKNKKWLVAILIICVFTTAFAYVENHNKSKVKVVSNNAKTSIKTKLTSTNIKNTQNKVNAQNKISVKKKAATQKSIVPKPVKKTYASKGKKDKYLTDPVPEGKPKPVEWQNAKVDENKKLICTLSITCKTILDNMDKFDKDKLEVLPKDGVIYKAQKITFYEGESVFDVLLREVRKNKIHMEFEMTPIYNSNYIEGIHNLYEFDCGELSGWMYKVNGWFPNYGCSRYMLKNKDIIDWIYTCDLGRDIGGEEAIGEIK
jgi:hypothetical protein